ncbi:MAG: CDP-alcohol phosphatidyltransferase family protein [Actinomycetota bacterium]|nr:CDP-alcohol phosphatidyltransferase family protein [Actinomycetota bacterium]
MSTDRVLTAPNLITLLRLLCLPIFLWLLFSVEDKAGAAWLLGALGSTDWVDGWVARKFGQQSSFGAVFDPTVDRGMFIVAVLAIVIDQSMPLWFAVAVLIREISVAAAMVIATAFGMQRFSVSIWGKRYTFLLMFAVPLMLLAADDGRGADLVSLGAWAFAIPGIILSYSTALAYIPEIRRNLRLGREARRG